MQKQPWEDCNSARLPFYRPLQAAIRWCGITDQESKILSWTTSVYAKQGEFSQWPCLYVHSESIRAAMESGALPYGRDGRAASDHVTPERRTVSHADLKTWIRKEYPADVRKPHMAWLFDEVERSIHPAVSTDAYATLKAEADALKKRAEDAENRAKEAEAKAAAVGTLDPRERTSLLRIIRALDVMAKLPKAAASSIEAQLHAIGFNGPGDTTIRNVIEQARALEPDEKSQ